MINAPATFARLVAGLNMSRSSSSRTGRKTNRKQSAPLRSTAVRTSSRSTGSVTLNDVARLAGVSPITVSRVLNHPELVTPNTIEHVRQVIARTGYVPNLLAGGLASRRTKLVAAIVPQITTPMFAEMIQCLTDRLWEAGYQVVLGLSGYAAHREEELLATILSRRPDAIFLTGINHSAEGRRRLLAARIPVVETWDLTPTPIDMLVGFSHEKIGQAVAEYLLDKGYRRFGLVWADDERAAVRRAGFMSVLGKHGVTDVPASIVPTPATLRRGREGLAGLIDGGAKFDAVFCSGDPLALGVLAEAQARGLAVPHDLAIMGFGDVDFAAHTFPALSTVRIDRPAIARLAAEALLTRIDGRTVAEKVVDIGFELIERGTT